MLINVNKVLESVVRVETRPPQPDHSPIGSFRHEVNVVSPRLQDIALYPLMGNGVFSDV